MRGLALVFIAIGLTLPAGAAETQQCAPRERLFDLTGIIPPGTASVWLVPFGSIDNRITYYELGYPEGRIPFGGRPPGSNVPRRLDLHGPGLICVAGDGVEGFVVQHATRGT
jgi:hypothetical protein